MRVVSKPLFRQILRVRPPHAVLRKSCIASLMQSLPQRGRLPGAQRLGQREDRPGLRGDRAGQPEGGRVEVLQGVLGQVRRPDRPPAVRQVVGGVRLDLLDPVLCPLVTERGQRPGAAERRLPVLVVEPAVERPVQRRCGLPAVHPLERAVPLGLVQVDRDDDVQVPGGAVGALAGPLRHRPAEQVHPGPVLPVAPRQARVRPDALVEARHHAVAHVRVKAAVLVEQVLVQPGRRAEDAGLGDPGALPAHDAVFPLRVVRHFPDDPQWVHAAP